MNVISPIVAFAVAVITVPIVRSFALRKGLLDVPNRRSSHNTPTPRTGGIGILAGSTAGLVAALFSSSTVSDSSAPGWPFLALVAALMAGAAVGFLDDLFGMPTAIRMLLYLAISITVALFFARVSVFDLPLVPASGLGAAGGVIFSALFIAWYTNLFNFMDGIDAIAGGAALISLGSLAFVFFVNDLNLLGLLAFSASAAVVGFLIYNFPPASVFMGDGGSVFLGMTIGALSIAAVDKGILSLAASVFLMLPFVFDATFTLCRRILQRERFWAAHRSHVYQQMCDLGFSHLAVSSIYTGAALAFAVIGLMFDEFTRYTQGALWWGCWVALLLVSVVVVRKNQKA